MNVPNVMVILGTGVILACIFIFLSIKQTMKETIGTNGLIAHAYFILIVFFFFAYLFQIYTLIKTDGKSGSMALASVLLMGSFFVLISLFLMKQMMKQIIETKLNQIDCATGLLNKSAGAHSIALRMKRNEPHRAFYIMDIDHFKKVNDTYGHMEGDGMIQTIACTLRDLTEGEDVIYRFGGDEFGIYAARNTRQELIELGKKLIHTLNGYEYLLNQETLTVSCSLGAAEVCQNQTFEQVFRRADMTLYHVKRTERGTFEMKLCPEVRKGISFRDYEPQNLEQLTDIMTRAFDDDTRMHTALEQDGPAGYRDGSLIQKLEETCKTLQEIHLDGNLIGGFAIQEETTKRAVLDMLFLDPDYKSQGLGKQVWSKIEDQYGYRQWKVETPEYSKRNIHFYCETCGFHQVGENIYEDGEKSVLMEKSVMVKDE